MSASESGAYAISLVSFLLLTVFFFVTPVPGASQEAPSGEDLYITQLGCGGCHGYSGEGAMGPALQDGKLPLRDFVRLVRAPRELMPRFSPMIVSDSDLAVIYDWLNGVEELDTPLPLAFSAEGFGAEATGSFSLHKAELNGSPVAADAESVRLRLTLTKAGDEQPVSGHRIAIQLSEDGEWQDLETDCKGQVVLNEKQEIKVDDSLANGKSVLTSLNISDLLAGRYSVILEALSGRESVLGIGSAVITVD